MKWFNNIPPFLKNRYFLVGFGFVVWMSFFDNNNFLFHRSLIEKKEVLQEEYFHLQRETVKNKIFLRNLNNPEFLEKYAREQFLMKRAGEDIYMIDEQK